MGPKFTAVNVLLVNPMLVLLLFLALTVAKIFQKDVGVGPMVKLSSLGLEL